jgi:GGDEF domain-containing protein
VPHEGARLAVGTSAGCAMLLATDSPGDVIARADIAMYERKRARR